jgi:hypothetical protein
MRVSDGSSTPGTNAPPVPTNAPAIEAWTQALAAASNTHSPTTPSSTFGSNPNPSYDPNAPANVNSNNGRTAANGVLRDWPRLGGLQVEAPIVAQTLGQHQNDPTFLQQYLGTLGSGRVAQIFSYLSSVQNGAANQQYQEMATALSTLAKNNDFSQNDMDQFVTQFANTSSRYNYFAKDVLSMASPRVNQMFYESAKNYALKNSRSSTGQIMAAYAMQALSQTANPLPQLASLPSGELQTLVGAAMKGESAYGNPTTPAQYAKTGRPFAQSGQGDPLTGLGTLMFDAAYANVGDQFAPALLPTSQAQSLQTSLFQDAMGLLTPGSQSYDPDVNSFYTQNVPSQGVSMKDALASLFQNDYASIVQLYSTEPNHTLSPEGMQTFQEFFALAVFTPPPSPYASGAIQTILSQINNLASLYPPSGGHSPEPPDQEQNYAISLGEQAEAMAAGLQEALTSILSGETQAYQGTQNLINGIITFGEVAGGTFGGPPGAIGSAIVGEALRLVVLSGHPPSQTDAIKALSSHGIDVNVNGATIVDLVDGIKNETLSSKFFEGVGLADQALGFTPPTT